MEEVDEPDAHFRRPEDASLTSADGIRSGSQAADKSASTDDGRARVVVCDGHSAIQMALEVKIAETSFLELGGSTSRVDELPELLSTLDADVLVLELTLSGAVGLALIRKLKASLPRLKIVVYTMYDEAIYAARAIRAGASAYVRKQESTDVVIEAIRSALNDQLSVSPSIEEQLAHGLHNGRSRTLLHPTNILSDQEMAVFQLVGEGMSLQDVARELGVSKSQAAELEQQAAEKLGLGSTESLVQYASRIVHQ